MMMSITIYIKYLYNGYKAYVPLLPQFELFGTDLINIETELMESIKNHIKSLPAEEVPFYLNRNNFKLTIMTVE